MQPPTFENTSTLKLPCMYEGNENVLYGVEPINTLFRYTFAFRKLLLAAIVNWLMPA